MTLIIKTTANNQEVTLPISNSTGLEINWDSENTSSTFEAAAPKYFPKHTYPLPGEYEVQIQGEVGTAGFGFDAFNYTYEEINSSIVEIKYWGENGFRYINSFGGKLRSEIPLPSRNSFEKVEMFRYTFGGCTNLIGSIPDELFANCPLVYDFLATFSECSGLTGNIPSKLFLNCLLVENFSGTFSECSGLTGNIPRELFSNCSLVENFSGTFSECSGLTGNIPGELLLKSENISYLAGIFRNCSGLEGNIPSNLFFNAQNVTDFNEIFTNCSGLTGILEGLFANCTNAMLFCASFKGCTGLTEIPENLFTNCTNAKYFQYAFDGCINLICNAPELWVSHSTANGTYCFRGCTNLTNYSDAQAAGWI